MNQLRYLMSAVIIGSLLMFVGCSKEEKTVSGVLIGAGTGAAIGGIAGGGTGAGIGAGVGAITGGLIGHSMGDDDK